MVATAGGVLLIGRRSYNPPINADEWLYPSLFEAGSSGRRDAGLAAGAAVRQEKIRLERDLVSRLATRLEQTKGELQLALISASDFKRFQIQALIRDLERALANAKAAVLETAKSAYQTAADLGDAHATEPIKAAQLDVSTIAGVSPTLVQHAYDNTAELLTEPMQQFRSRIVQDVRRMALNAESFGDRMAVLARGIGDAGFDAAEFKTERILRTELGRTFSGATFERMLDLSRRAPFMRKIWIRTNDSRTRQTHLAAGALYVRGKGIKIPELFKVGAATMRFPIDPLVEPAGKIGARETIMCRCNAAVDFDVAELAAATKARVQFALGQVEPTPEPTPPPPPIVKPGKPKIVRTKRVRTAAELAVAARKKLATIEAKYDARQTELERALVKNRVDLMDMRRAIDNPANADLNLLNVLRQEKQTLESAFIKVAKALETLKADKIAAMRRTLFLDKANQYGKNNLRWHFSNPRLVGTGWSAMTGKALNPKEMTRRVKTVVATLEKLFSRRVGYLGDIGVTVQTDAAGVPDILARAFARQVDNSINIALAESERVMAHELGHILEFNDAEIRRKVRDFYARRTAGEKLEKLSDITGIESYKDVELARRDKFLDPYMGKDYGASPYTEIVSMGVEYFYADPLKLATQDPDYFDFIFRLLRGEG